MIEAGLAGRSISAHTPDWTRIEGNISTLDADACEDFRMDTAWCSVGALSSPTAETRQIGARP